MKPDQERVKNLLTDTVTLLCKNGLHYQKELKVQGLLGITLDENEVFVVHINEKFGDLVASSGLVVSGDDADSASQFAINTAAIMRMNRATRPHSDEPVEGEPPRKRPEPLRSRKRPSRDGAISPKVSSPGSSRSDSQLSASVSSPAGQGKLDGAHRDIDPANLPDIKIKQETEDEVIIVGGQTGQGDSNIPGSGDDRNAMQETYSSATLSDLQSGDLQLEQITSGLDQTLAGSGLDTGVPSAKRKASLPSSSSADQMGSLGPFITGMVRNQSQTTGSSTATSAASDLSQWDSAALAGMGQLSGEGQSGVEATPGCSTWDPSQISARQGAQGADDSYLCSPDAVSISEESAQDYMAKLICYPGPVLLARGIRRYGPQCLRVLNSLQYRYLFSRLEALDLGTVLRSGQLFVKKHPEEVDCKSTEMVLFGVPFFLYTEKYSSIDGYIKTLKKETMRNFLEFITAACGKTCSDRVGQIWKKNKS